MVDVDSEHKQRRRDQFLVGKSAVLGALASAFYNMMRDILTGQTTTYYVDFCAGAVTAVVFYIVLKYTQREKRADVAEYELPEVPI